MQALKSGFGVAGALMPILYCGGLAYYFLDLSGSAQEAAETGLGPTVVGLGVVGLLFCIPLIIRVVRIFSGPRSPGSGPDTSSRDDENGAEADAAIARYLARNSMPARTSAAIASPARSAGGVTRHTGFGRKTR